MKENVYTVSCITYAEYLFLISVFNFFPESDLSDLNDKCKMLVYSSQDFTYDELSFIFNAIRFTLDSYSYSPNSFYVDFVTCCNLRAKFKRALLSEETEETNGKEQCEEDFLDLRNCDYDANDLPF